ncbi:cyclopropane fatty acyl phospholipid synthase [Aliamphritea hakodatensis]|uniref:cyclopropane fatty acyl phospholipid synthase n=1 Tax=Aliamphritea hakodatensis TaxID=2895352 RepID=UPI0022FD64A4|nr:cyclopropane fatty acyl phospholipid synthase [Aliamphritea hakodatensis]
MMNDKDICSSGPADMSGQTPPFSPPSPLESYFTSQLSSVGITVNGSNPWDPQVHNPALWLRILKQGTVGLGEAYMEGWWDCISVEELIRRILEAGLDPHFTGRRIPLKEWFSATLFNRQSVKRAFQVGEQHYDAGNDLYEAMLDPTMAYSCGYWKDTTDLHQAQLNKLRLTCHKAQLSAGEHVLDIGCGWGSFAELAAREYGVRVCGITVSEQQEKLARERCRGLPVSIRLLDYRSLQGQYDKAVSIGMFEHVGPKNYLTYMHTVHNCLKDEGIFVLHTIGSDTRHQGTDPWIDKYIFPNGAIPALSEISAAAEPWFVIEDVHNFGQDYATTLRAWHHNFEQHWPQLQASYSEQFYRMWSYYLKTCTAAFQSRSLQLYQLVLRKRLVPLPRYQSPR